MRFSGGTDPTRARRVLTHLCGRCVASGVTISSMEAPDVLITISVFDSADDAFASNENAADWVRNNVLEFTKGMPEVMVGNTLIAEIT